MHLLFISKTKPVAQVVQYYLLASQTVQIASTIHPGTHIPLASLNVPSLHTSQLSLSLQVKHPGFFKVHG